MRTYQRTISHVYLHKQHERMVLLSIGLYTPWLVRMRQLRVPAPHQSSCCFPFRPLHLGCYRSLGACGRVRYKSFQYVPKCKRGSI